MGCRWVDEPSVTTGSAPYVRASYQATSDADTFSRDNKYSVCHGSQPKTVTSHTGEQCKYMSCIFRARVRLKSDFRIHLVCFPSINCPFSSPSST